MIAKKKYIIISLALILTVIGYLSLKEKETVFYIGISNPSEDIDIMIKLDNERVLEDTLEYNPYNYTIVKRRLRGGFHNLSVKSNKVNLEKEKTLFLLLKQHVVVEYFPESDDMKEEASFCIRSRLSPFYLE